MVRLAPLPATPDQCQDPPVSLLIDGQASADRFRLWTRETIAEHATPVSRTVITRWTDPQSGLRIEWQQKRYTEYGAWDGFLAIEHAGTGVSPLISEIQSLDGWLGAPRESSAPFRLQRTNGAPSNPTDFEPRTIPIGPGASESLGGGGGRSSNRDFPFFRIESGDGTAIVAVGWSGQWAATVAYEPEGRCRIRAGLERTHFRLQPGERVRLPRILFFYEDRVADEASARFRQLIHKHYCAPKFGREPLPTLYCNTCFTRGGAWLNECNAENQISLIRAYAPLGLEALLTDAGWFEGGWPEGAGNWTPRRDAYPRGMGPVAAAAKEHGMIYGLWFEPERVVAGTGLHRQHPEWLLASMDEPEGTYLLNFGLPAVRDYFFGVVKGFMDLPGFRVYRQDFNMDPLPYWRHTDAPDRQGMTEIRYIEGLYAYWDRIAQAWPDALRIECASGGRRIDLETIRRMHVHQKSDYWFDNPVDQASLHALSAYLPNNIVMTPLNRLDDVSFFSALPASMCLGWIADADDFDLARARTLVERYRDLRPLLTRAWYPLTPCSREADAWLASQYHDPDTGEGLVLAFRREACALESLDVKLRGIDEARSYLLTDICGGSSSETAGVDLTRLTLTVSGKPGVIALRYRRLP